MSNLLSGCASECKLVCHSFRQPFTKKEDVIPMFLTPLNPNVHSEFHENSLKICNKGNIVRIN